jgi:hypothetical protein
MPGDKCTHPRLSFTCFHLVCFFVGLGFDLSTSYLLGRSLTAWATPQALFCDGFFWDRVSWTIFHGCLWTTILLISASWVARITGLRHWHLASLCFSTQQIAVIVLCQFFFRLTHSPCFSFPSAFNFIFLWESMSGKFLNAYLKTFPFLLSFLHNNLAGFSAIGWQLPSLMCFIVLWPLLWL